VFTADGNTEFHNPYHNEVVSGEEDVSITATHVMLEAADLDLGTCFNRYVFYDVAVCISDGEIHSDRNNNGTISTCQDFSDYFIHTDN